jgi:hypothetical protein
VLKTICRERNVSMTEAVEIFWGKSSLTSGVARTRGRRRSLSDRRMKMKSFNNDRVEETAAFIAAELRKLLDRMASNSHMSQRIREACPAYRNGLTNGERVLATLRALSMAQLDVAADLASLDFGADDDIKEDEAA